MMSDQIAEWKRSARLARQDVFLVWTSIASVALFVLSSMFLGFRLLPVGWHSGVLITHYNVYLGIDDVRPWIWLLLFIGIGALILVLDVFCIGFFFRRDPVASRTMAGMMLASTILWVVACFFLVMVNV